MVPSHVHLSTLYSVLSRLSDTLIIAAQLAAGPIADDGSTLWRYRSGLISNGSIQIIQVFEAK